MSSAKGSHRFSTTAILLVVLALVAAACGGSDATVSSESEESTEAPTSEQSATTEAPEVDEEPADEPADTVAPITAAPATTAAPAPELELVGEGPYSVGVTTITIDADTERPLTVDVWFPLVAGTTGDPQQYTLLPGTYYESPKAIVGDPATISPDGNFPLVVYSHGSGGLRYIHSNYTEVIASNGYVVVAPDHTGNTSLELISGNPDDSDVIAFNRPNDVRNVIDALLDSTSAAAAFTPSVDPERIAVTGHSFGGYTAFASVIGHDNPAGTIEPDERVDAIITLAPATGNGLLSDERLAAISVPNMAIVGTDDATTPVDPNVTRPWELSTVSPTYRVELVAAEHQTFTDVCDYQVFLPTLEAVPEIISSTIADFAEAGCQPDDMPIARAQELTNTFALHFLAEVFQGAPAVGSNGAAMPDDVLFDAK